MALGVFMKNQIYTFGKLSGALAIALFGLTSFNPQTQFYKVSQVEGSATLASDSKPTEKPKEKPIVKPTVKPKKRSGAKSKAQIEAAKASEESERKAKEEFKQKDRESSNKPNIFTQRFNVKGSTAEATTTPIQLDATDGKSYIIHNVKASISVGNKPSKNLVIKMSEANNSANTVEVCVREISNTEGSVCTTCVPQPGKCIARSDIDYIKLIEGDEDAFNSLINAGKIIVAGFTKENKDVQAKIDADEKNCNYGKNYDKIIECAQSHYKDAKNKEETRKYARIFKNAVFKLAKNTEENSELCDLISDFELTSTHEPELYKASRTSCVLSQAYKEFSVYDRLKSSYTKMNLFDYYQYRLDYTVQTGQQNIENWQYLGNQRMANESYKQLQNDIYSLSRDYRGRLRSLFGPSSIHGDDYGLSPSDYAELIGPFVNTAASFADLNGRTGQDLLGLATLANDPRAGLDPITGRNTINGTNITSQQCTMYDPQNPNTPIPCLSPTVSNNLGKNRGSGRSGPQTGPFDGRVWIKPITQNPNLIPNS